MTGDRKVTAFGALAIIAGASLYALGHMQIGCAVGYTGLGLTVVGRGWPCNDHASIGVALLISTLAGLFAFYFVPSPERPAIDALGQMIVTIAVYLAFLTGGPRRLVLIAAIAAGSAALSVWFSWHWPSPTIAPLSVRRLYQLTLNGCYVAECLIFHASVIYERRKGGVHPRARGYLRPAA